MGLLDPEQNSSQDGAMQSIPEPMAPAKTPESLNFDQTKELIGRSAPQNNWFASSIVYGFGDRTKSDPNFNPLTGIKDTKYEAYPEYFINADNEQDMLAGKQQVDDLEKYQELYQRSPSVGFWSSMAWGILDPLLAIPGYGSAAIVESGMKASIVGTAAATAAISATAMGTSEAILQGTHPERTALDSTLNIAAAGVVGAAFGGLVAKTMNRGFTNLAEKGVEGLSAKNKIPNASETIKSELTAGPSSLEVSQDEATSGVKQVLSITNDEIPAPLEQSKLNLAAAENKSIIDIVNEHNMEGHTTPTIRQWELENPPEQLHTAKEDIVAFNAQQGQLNTSRDVMNEDKAVLNKLAGISPEEVPQISDEEIAQALAPKGGSVLDLQNPEKQGIGAQYMSFDSRIKGLPDWMIKAIAIPHVSNVSIEGMASPSAVVRDFTTRIGYMHFPLKGSTGEQITAPISMESAMQQDMLEALNFNKAMDKSYLRYLQLDPDATSSKLVSLVKSRMENTLSSKKLDELTMDAMNAGDAHEIPAVQERAQYTRNILNDKWKQMQDVGLIDKNQTPFPNYFKVVYDINKIINGRMAMEEALTRRFLNKLKAEVTFTVGDKEATVPAVYNVKTKSINWEPRPGETLKNIVVRAPLSIDEAREAASDSIDNILQMGDKNLALGDIDRLSFTRGTDSGKPRKIVMDNEDYEALKPWMIQDFRKIMQTYMASTSRAVNFKKLLNDLGVDSIQEMRVRIKDEFKAHMYTANNIKTATKEEIKAMPKSERNNFITQEKKDAIIGKLTRQSMRSEKLFNDIVAISLGQFKKRTPADAFWRTVNQYNVARLYGGIVVSSIGDPTAMLIKNSIPNALWNGWLAELKQVLTLTKNYKTQDYRNALTAIQNEMDDLVRFLMNPDEGNYIVGKKERFAQVAGNLQMKASGMILWNNFWQRASHNLAEHNILNYAQDTVKSKNISFLKEIGIDENMAKRILRMQKKYGFDIRGTHVSNSHQWSDRDAADHFNNAIRLEVHKSPIITEMLDIPRFFQKSELRKSMILGKGFNFAAVNKLVLSMASRHDHRALTGFISLVAAGMVVTLLKDKIAGRNSDYSLKDWIINGIDKSGALGMLSDPFLQARYAIRNTERWGSRAWTPEPLDYIFGPSAGIINPAYHGIISKLSGKPIDKKTEYQLKALIPYQNLWYLQKSSKGN